MLRCIYGQRLALKQMVASPKWAAWPTSRNTLAHLYFETIIQEKYWPPMRHLLLVCLPIVSLLQLVDNEVPYLRKVYKTTDGLIENIQSLTQIRPTKKREGS